MSYVPVQPLLEKVDNTYHLVLIASQRALQLANGAPSLVEVSPKKKISTIAIEEIRQGKIIPKKRESNKGD